MCAIHGETLIFIVFVFASIHFTSGVYFDLAHDIVSAPRAMEGYHLLVRVKLGSDVNDGNAMQEKRWR